MDLIHCSSVFCCCLQSLPDLNSGFSLAMGPVIMTITSYHQAQEEIQAVCRWTTAPCTTNEEGQARHLTSVSRRKSECCLPFSAHLLSGAAFFHLSSAALPGRTSLPQPVVHRDPPGLGTRHSYCNAETHNRTLLPPWWEATPTYTGNDAGKIPWCSSHGPRVPALLADMCGGPWAAVHCLPCSPVLPLSLHQAARPAHRAAEDAPMAG